LGTSDHFIDIEHPDSSLTLAVPCAIEFSGAEVSKPATPVSRLTFNTAKSVVP